MFIPYFTCTENIGILVIHAIPLQIFNELSHKQLPVETTNFYLKLFRPPLFSTHNPSVSASHMYLVQYLQAPALGCRVAINLGIVQEQ